MLFCVLVVLLSKFLKSNLLDERDRRGKERNSGNGKLCQVGVRALQ